VSKQLTLKRSFYFLCILFFTWGFLTVLVDSLIPRLKEIFELSYFEAGLIQFAFFLAYGLGSIPSGEYLQKSGYKSGLIKGLLMMGVGCLFFILAAQARWYLLFLIGLFTMAGGMTLIQVAANPFVLTLGSKKSAPSRLNMAQGFNSIGTTIAPIVGALTLLNSRGKTAAQISEMSTIKRMKYIEMESAAVQGPFLTIAICLFLLALLFWFLKLPAIKNEKAKVIAYSVLLKNKMLRFGATAIFVYVGAEVAIGSYLVNYFLTLDMSTVISSNPHLNLICSSLLGSDLSRLSDKAIVGAFVAFYWGGAMVGRFIGAYLYKIFSPAKVLSSFAIGAMLMLILSIFSEGSTAMWAIIAVGLFNSIMFPTIYFLSMDNIKEYKAQASGILCTAIIGGALIPPLFGFIVDISGFKAALLLPLACYVYICWYGNWKLFEFPKAVRERFFRKLILART